MTAPHEPDRQHPGSRLAWPEGFREHLVEQCDGFSSIMSRAIADNGASLFRDGPYAPSTPQAASMDATSVMFRKIRAVWREFLWPR
ncbi:inositol 2-dehydrogenase [Rhodococcus sp. BP-241]|uniref:inositol 2-dehydrogenase n=1 Tax=Rhodococcus sp. BP-241 TaxID=2739441 RepID=UPI001C9B099F|nr:inositol 2-dehydrogenase [Rhodococcus sp. BP-241]MBY6705866.1 inositol 2-dehydrogenase [Rhodococcus sp. BP-241]